MESVYEVPSEIQPIIEKFEVESQKLGRSIFITNLTIDFRSNLGEGVRAISWSNNGQNRISIDPEYLCWNGSQITAGARNTFRELLLFHELGHLFLSRTHKEGTIPVLNPVLRSTQQKKNSIMALDISCRLVRIFTVWKKPRIPLLGRHTWPNHSKKSTFPP